MVRKWSYLTRLDANHVDSTFGGIPKTYTFKVFRMTTRFKKFQRYETIFVRKQDSSRKRQTSWLTLVSIFSQWALQYMKCRQYLRYYQSTGTSLFTMIVPNIFALQKKINVFNPQLTFTTSTLTQNFITLTNLTSKVNKYNSTRLTTLSSDVIQSTIFKDVHVSTVSLENHYFTQNSIQSSYWQQTLPALFQSLSTPLISYVTHMYKILILITLNNISIHYEVRYKTKFTKFSVQISIPTFFRRNI